MVLDVDKSMPPAGPLRVRAGESGMVVSAAVVDQGMPCDLSGAVATFRAMWRGGHASSPCEVDGCAVSWEMPEVPVPGRLLAAYVELAFDGGMLVTTQEIEAYALEEARWKFCL